MDIKSSIFNDRLPLVALIMLMILLLAGCNSTLPSTMSPDTEFEIEHPFFGTWLLEELVLRVYHIGELELPAPPALVPVIEDFL